MMRRRGFSFVLILTTDFWVWVGKPAFIINQIEKQKPKWPDNVVSVFKEPAPSDGLLRPHSATSRVGKEFYT